MRRTLVVAIATFSLMAGGTGAVIAGGGQKSDGDNDADDHGGGNAGKKQYSHCKKSNPQPNCVPKTCKKSQNPQTDNCSPKPPKPPKGSGNGSNGSHKGGGSHNGGSHQSH